MSAWLARLKNSKGPDTHATKPTKPATDTPARGFVGFVAYPQGHIQKIDGAVASPDTPAASSPSTDPDRWAWPHSSAMNGRELDTMMARQALFMERGAGPQDAERLADELALRDRDGDDRRLCLECRHLRGDGPYRCGNAGAASLHPDLPRDLVLTLQRCHGFDPARLPVGVMVDAVPPAPAPAPAPNSAPAVPAAPGLNWRELDRAYLAHHTRCVICQSAGRGYGQRCSVGAELWAAYRSASTQQHLKEQP